LTSPKPLVRVSDWARQWAVGEVFGIDPATLNDDRLGRALDAIAPELEAIIGSVGTQAISAFGIDVSQLHWDMTSVSLFGAYEGNDEQYPAPRFGHPKDRRRDLKQVQAGPAVTADGAIPVFHRAYDGGAGEIAQVVDTMTALTNMATPRDFLLIGDSKLVSYTNLAAMTEAGVAFLAPASKTYVPAEVLAALDIDTAVEVDHVAERDLGKPAARRGRWRVIEDTMALAGPRKKDPVLTLRRVFVHSSARAQAAVTARARKLDHARDDLQRLARGLGSRHYPDAASVTARITAISRARRIGAYLQTTVDTHSGTAKPTLIWAFDEQALAAEAATDGWYALLTSLDLAQVDAPEVLRRYKGPGGRRTPLQHGQGAAGRGTDVPQEQPADRRTGHRDLPGTTRFLPDRTPGAVGDRPAHQARRTLYRAASQTHRPVDFRGPGPVASHPGHHKRTTRHPATTTTAGPAPGSTGG
jgi:hypothetical protein